MAKKVFTTGEVAKLLGVNINTVIKWFDEGQLSGFRLPMSNERRIPIATLRQFMAANMMPMDLLEETTPMRRLHNRVPCRIPATMSVTNKEEFGPYSVQVLNVSEGGARVLMEGDQALSIPIGNFDLSLKVTDGPLDGTNWKGKIAHLETAEKDLSLGIEFATLEEPEKGRLTQFIEKLSG